MSKSTQHEWPVSKRPYRRLSEARGAVVRFLKANPFSTSEEIYQATNCYVSSVLKKGWFKNYQRDGKRVWRVVASPEELL